MWPQRSVWGKTSESVHRHSWIALLSGVAAARIVMIYFQKDILLWLFVTVTKNHASQFLRACPVRSPALPYNMVGLWADRCMPTGHPEIPSPLRLMGEAIIKRPLLHLRDPWEIPGSQHLGTHCHFAPSKVCPFYFSLSCHIGE